MIDWGNLQIGRRWEYGQHVPRPSAAAAARQDPRAAAIDGGDSWQHYGGGRPAGGGGGCGGCAPSDDGLPDSLPEGYYHRLP